ncbi:MAG: argininosuccinate lyase, partial [Planctomycetota bacterium]
MAIWSKGGDDTNTLVHAFTVGDDYRFDRDLAPYDCLGSIAHARMLGETGIIPADDAEALEQGLRQLHRSFQAREWTIESTDEDVHSKIELLLTERLGDPARRLHTGRSRNDQVLTDLRLWIKDRVAGLALRTVAVAETMLSQAREHEFCPLPGYTHLQRGMPSSVGMFFASHARALLDDLILMEAAWRFADSCPLGSGASYGVGLPLDRERVARLLGFERFGAPAMADANSRGKVETAVLDAASAILGDCSRLAADLVFFTTAECGYFSLGSGFTTGSSIMPQKKNPDIFELLRGRTARFLGLRTGLAATTIGLHSGYSRDLQDTKALLIEGVRLLEQALAVLLEAVPSLEPR